MLSYCIPLPIGSGVTDKPIDAQKGFGGTSIWITSIAFGVMLSVSRFAARKNKNAEIKQEMNILSEDLKAQNPT